MPATRKAFGRTGAYVEISVLGQPARAFVPPPLPPDPAVRVEPLYAELEAANRALGRLDGVTAMLPATPLFLYMYVRKEALLSAQIEGTQSSLSDLILYESDEAPGVPVDDVEEVSNYVAAMNLGIERMRGGERLSNELIRELHGVLLKGGRGSRKQPGEFRRTQNWIGGSRPGNARFVPPPPDRVSGCMRSLEAFINERGDGLPLLARAALAHVQFETIHPFLDGNGRLGRLLITLMLVAEGALKEPILYLSLYFKTHRRTYYDLLQGVRGDGDWEAWLGFFLEGVRETAEQAVNSARKILALVERDRAAIEELGRPAASALKVHQYLQTKPIISVPAGAYALSLSAPTIRKSINHLVDLGLLEEITGKERDRLFAYREYLDTLARGTEPL